MGQKHSHSKNSGDSRDEHEHLSQDVPGPAASGEEEPVRLSASPAEENSLKIRVIGDTRPILPRQSRDQDRAEAGIRIDGSHPQPSADDEDGREEDEAVHRLEVEPSAPAPVVTACAVEEPPVRVRQETVVAQPPVPVSVPAAAPDEPSGAEVVPYRNPSAPRVKKSLTTRQWTIVMAASSPLLVIGAVLLTQMGSKPLPSDVIANREVLRAEEIVLDDSEISGFIRNLGALQVEARDVLTRYAEAKTAEDALPLLRDPDRVRQKFLAKWTPWPLPLFQRDEIPAVSVTSWSGRAAVILQGHRGDFTPFCIYFIQHGGKLKLDWEASYGVGDYQLAELGSLGEMEPAVIRVKIRPDHFFTSAYPEDTYESYQLSGPGGEEVIWAYTENGSPVAEKMAGLLNRNSLVLEEGREVEATLRIGKKSAEKSRHFLLLEVIHPGWVSP